MHDVCIIKFLLIAQDRVIEFSMPGPGPGSRAILASAILAFALQSNLIGWRVSCRCETLVFFGSFHLPLPPLPCHPPLPTFPVPSLVGGLCAPVLEKGCFASCASTSACRSGSGCGGSWARGWDGEILCLLSHDLVFLSPPNYQTNRRRWLCRVR